MDGSFNTRAEATYRQPVRRARRRSLRWALTLVLSLPSASAWSQSPIPSNAPPDRGGTSAPTPPSARLPDDSLEALLARPGDVAFRKTALAEAVFSLSEVWGVNIVAGSDVQGEVSGIFTQSPLSEVLDAVLGANGYGYRRSGRSLIIMPIEEIGAEDPNLLSTTLQLPTPPDQQDSVIKAAEMLLSPRGRIQALPSNNSLLVVDYRVNIERLRAFFAELGNANVNPTSLGPSTSGNTIESAPMISTGQEVDSNVAYFAPQYVLASELQTPLADALGGSAVLSVMSEENRILVVGEPEQLKMAAKIVEALDQPRTQVRIAALIYDVELRRGEELGIDWGKTLSINGSFGGGSSTSTSGTDTGTTGTDTGTGTTGGSATDAAASAAATGIAITLGTLEDTITLGNMIRALDETRGAHLLADPTITVEDRQEASIRIVTKIPYQQLTQTQQGGSIGTTAFEEAGIILTVTPRIARDGTIHMSVRPEFSTLVEYINGQPLIDTRAAETFVRVADRHTLVIGGLRRKQMRDAITGIPGLMKWKTLGKLFRAHDSGVSESELLVFLRPEIITPCDILGPRSSRAVHVAESHLDRIPAADHRCLVPDCHDCRCVYHNPRPNVNDGSPTKYPFEGGLVGEFGMEEITIDQYQDYEAVEVMSIEPGPISPAQSVDPSLTSMPSQPITSAGTAAHGQTPTVNPPTIQVPPPVQQTPGSGPPVLPAIDISPIEMGLSNTAPGLGLQQGRALYDPAQAMQGKATVPNAATTSGQGTPTITVEQAVPPRLSSKRRGAIR